METRRAMRLGVLAALILAFAVQVAWCAPMVTAISPPNGGTKVPVTASLTAVFNEEMDPESLTSGSFSLSRNVGVKALAGGRYHTVALKNDGTIVTWGAAGVVPELSGVAAVSARYNRNVVLKNDGTVTVFGQYWVYPPAGLNNVTAVASGVDHYLALKSNGTVIAWGDNFGGQCSVPTGLSGVTAIAAGREHSAALKSNGTVVTWGRMSNTPYGLTGVKAIAAGDYHNVALLNNGTVVAWGDSSFSNVPAGLSGVTAIAAGALHTLALKSDGTVVAWGYNAQGQCSVPGGLTGVVAIATGDNHSMALKNDGSIVAWGDSSYSLTTIPSPLAGIVAVAAGVDFTLALKGDGTVAAWGGNAEGQTAVPAGLTGVTAIAAGGRFAAALRNDGTVVAWGQAGHTDVPPGLTGVTAISAGLGQTLALKNDGTVVTWGAGHPVPAGLTGVTAVAAGTYHSVALKSNGTVVAWGENQYGQSSVPPGLTGVTAIAADTYHTVALKNDGTVVIWGPPPYTAVPESLTGVIAIDAGSTGATLALKSDGTVVAWGGSTVPAGLTGVAAMSTGGGTDTVALKKDGTVVAWGWNSYGQSTVPSSPYETIVSGTVNYAPATRTATFVPEVPLTSYGSYIARTNSGARSLTGTRLAERMWTFTTQDIIAPVTTVQPAGGSYSSAQSVTLTCNDYSGIGCDSSYYCFGSGCTPDIPYSGAIAITASRVLRFFSADNSGNNEAVRTVSYSIPPPTISGIPPTAANVGVPYSFTPTATNAASFTITGNLPPGLELNPATGSLRGTPTTPGSYAGLTITAVNEDLTAVLPSFSITVGPRPTSTTAVVDIAATGQTKCYSGAGSEIPCAGTGQDGAFQTGVPWPVSRFTNNGNGTVTDNLTGLVWLRNANCTETVGGISKPEWLTWSNALRWSSALSSGACNLSDGSRAGDWRLPNRNEMLSLVNRQQRDNAAWLHSLGFYNVQGSNYWTSTSPTVPSTDLNVAATIYMRAGLVYNHTKETYLYAWPVRDGK